MESGASVVGAAVTQVQSSLADFSGANLLEIIAGGLLIAVPLVITWFAFRWIYKRAKGALKRGS